MAGGTLDISHGSTLDLTNEGISAGRTTSATVGVGSDSLFSVTDMASDNDVQIQAAIDYVKELGGGAVVLRPYKYRLSSPLVVPENVFLVGEKWAKMGTGGVTFKAAIGVTLEHLVEVTGASNPTTNAELMHDTGFRDITFDGNGTTTNCVLLTNQDTIIFDHCRFVLATNSVKTVWDSTVDPIAATIPGGIRLIDCNISSVSGIGIDLDHQTQCWITNCWFTGTTVDTWIRFKSSNKIHLTNCEFNTATQALKFQDTATFPTNDITVNDCVFAGGKAWTEERTNATSNRVSIVGSTIVSGSADFLVGADNVLNNSNTRRQILLSNDFLVATGTQALDPFLGTAIASGTSNQPTAGIIDANHPGAIRLLSSTTTNSGFFVGTNISSIRLAGDDHFNAVFQLASLALNTTRLGFLDTATVADAVDGAYLEIDASGVVTGKTANNSTRSSTGTTYTISATTWYRAFIRTNAANTAVIFYLYNDAGTLLWTDTLSTNIPTASGREVGAAFVITNSGTTAIDLAHIDYMSFAIRRSVQRGGV